MNLAPVPITGMSRRIKENRIIYGDQFRGLIEDRKGIRRDEEGFRSEEEAAVRMQVS